MKDDEDGKQAGTSPKRSEPIPQRDTGRAQQTRGTSIPCLEKPNSPKIMNTKTMAKTTGRLTLRAPRVRRIWYMTPMMMPSGISWLIWVKAVQLAPSSPSKSMMVAPTTPKTIHPTEARYIPDSFSRFCMRPDLRERRRLRRTAASMAVMLPT